jgi:hypothetical protein
VRWVPDEEARIADVDTVMVDVQVSGTTATINTDGRTKHVRFIIEIRRVRMSICACARATCASTASTATRTCG